MREIPIVYMPQCGGFYNFITFFLNYWDYGNEIKQCNLYACVRHGPVCAGTAVCGNASTHVCLCFHNQHSPPFLSHRLLLRCSLCEKHTRLPMENKIPFSFPSFLSWEAPMPARGQLKCGSSAVSSPHLFYCFVCLFV